MLYAPLLYIQQLENYFREFTDTENTLILERLPNGQLVKSKKTLESMLGCRTDEELNKKALAWIDKNIIDGGIKHEFLNSCMLVHQDEKINSIYTMMRNNFSEEVFGYSGLYHDDVLEFSKYCVSGIIYNTWKWHKLSYKISDYMMRNFLDMEIDEIASCDCLTKVPASVFYIDTGNLGVEICKDFEGFFVIIDVNEAQKLIAIHLVSLVRNRKDASLMPIYNGTFCDLDNTPDAKYSLKEVFKQAGITKYQFEDGFYRKFNQTALLRLFYNFIVYLQASNKDVEKSVVTAKNFGKPIDKTKPVKNKFGEMKELEVGFKISSPVSKKYIYETKETTSIGTPKSPHFRRAHYHHYWKGSGESKELVVKWIEGVFVNGKREADVAVVHKVDNE